MGPFLDPVFDHPKKSEFSTFAIARPDFPENHTFFTFFPVFAKNSVFFVFFGFLPFSGIVLTPFFVKNGQKPSKTGQKGGPEMDPFSEMSKPTGPKSDLGFGVFSIKKGVKKWVRFWPKPAKKGQKPEKHAF